MLVSNMRTIVMAEWSHLALSHCAQCLDDRQLRLHIGCLVQEAHDGLHHLGGGLLELSMLLREQQHLLVHQIPVIRVLGYCDDGDDDAGR